MTTEPNNTKHPSHTAYVVREGKERGHWMEIGAAWPHRDNNGFDITLAALPPDGRIVLRVNDAPSNNV